MAIKACEILGLSKKNISKCINKLKSVKGRLELVREFPDQTKVFIDFAHTPDAIKTAITSLTEQYEKDITIVFGCGGERDKGKRAKMGSPYRVVKVVARDHEASIPTETPLLAV